MQAASDHDLVDASRRGDRDAFGLIVERYQRAVYAVSYSSVRDHALSDDLTQDTFVTAWHRLGELRDTTRLSAWLCAIARNHARDARKRRRRETGEVDIATSATPFDALSDAESDRLLAAALAAMPAAYREPLVLFYYEQRSADDVARILEINAAAVHKRLSRGRQYLAEELAERRLGRVGPKPALVARVLAAIGVGTASHVDASPATKGSTMQSKLTVAALAISVATVSVMSADTSRDRPTASAKPASSTAPAKPTAPAKAISRAPKSRSSSPAPSTSTPRTVSAPPVLATPAFGAPDCTTAGTHMATLAGTPKLRSFFIDKCTTYAWSENVRLCIVDADDYQRAKIDCADESPATTAEVTTLPPSLRCDVLADHVHALANGPDGKFTIVKRKLAQRPDRVAEIERMARALRDEMIVECNERPWSVARRRCIAASTTHAAYGDCT